MTKQYKIYLQSPAWQQKRNAVIARSVAGDTNANVHLGKCERCGYRPWRTGVLQVHHLTYEHIFAERLDELILLCPHCHKELTAEQQKAKGSDTVAGLSEKH
jgi:5-methylcytosine-specific restriction endonuclease McrA